MIPAEVLASDPAILEKAKELSERRICRLCLSEEDALVDMDVVWKMKILSCIPLVTIGSDKLPKFICEPCGKFVKKCFEFRQLCKKAEQLLVSYPLTGGWSGELVIPRWLHDEDHHEQVQVCKKRKAVEELVVPQVGSVRVRSHESMSLQSPTITPGSVEQTMQEMMVDVQPRQEVIDSYPTITPIATYAIPVIQSQPRPWHRPEILPPINTNNHNSRRPTNRSISGVTTRPLGNLTGGLPGRLRTCRFCTAPTFPTQGDLVQHLKLHERVGLTKACDFCAKYFADEERRNEHYRKDHADVVRQTLKLNDQ
ncbi:hypothetical protein pipiens_018032 [Culex pipiens pipiens]|uniref:ZAD domain-containing protein n=1 Tax=Culex pipiens pipiens TaxID=38569 RepID=A0ABD1CDX3_CULPP